MCCPRSRLNRGIVDKRSLAANYTPDAGCRDPMVDALLSVESTRDFVGFYRRQEVVAPGYVTSDDFGRDGASPGYSPLLPMPG